jgi:hypothetical protein
MIKRVKGLAYDGAYSEPFGWAVMLAGTGFFNAYEYVLKS